MATIYAGTYCVWLYAKALRKQEEKQARWERFFQIAALRPSKQWISAGLFWRDVLHTLQLDPLTIPKVQPADWQRKCALLKCRLPCRSDELSRVLQGRGPQAYRVVRTTRAICVRSGFSPRKQADRCNRNVERGQAARRAALANKGLYMTVRAKSIARNRDTYSQARSLPR